MWELYESFSCTRVVRELYERGTKVVRELYESCTRVVRGSCTRSLYEVVVRGSCTR